MIPSGHDPFKQVTQLTNADSTMNEKTTATRTPRCPPGAPTKPTRFVSTGFLYCSLLRGIALTQQHKPGKGTRDRRREGCQAPTGRGRNSPQARTRAPVAPRSIFVPPSSLPWSLRAPRSPRPCPGRQGGDPPSRPALTSSAISRATAPLPRDMAATSTTALRPGVTSSGRPAG